jgi:hypothetical protein
MCGVYHIGNQRFDVYCEIIDPFWWKHPDPFIDFSRVVFDRPIEAGNLETWRGELTEISRIIANAGYFEDKQLGDRLGEVAAEMGNVIAERAAVDVRIEWSAHAG